MATYSERLAQAEKHVADTLRVVERQRKIVEAHTRRTTNAKDAIALLETLERSLRIFEDELAAIRKEEATRA
jgi:hypothetical protein